MTMNEEWRYLNSSMLQGARYDPVNNELHVQFKNGAKYAYPGVSFGEFEELVHSSSPGSYFHNNIKSSYDGRPM